MIPRFGDRRRARIGLLGGSYNPAHAGHRALADLALGRLRLDQVWLLVSPGNPLKGSHDMAPLSVRMASARRIANGRRIVATDIESRLGTRYTIDTLRVLRRVFPRIRFVWLIGADNLLQLPRWRRWRDLARLAPIAVVPRIPATRPALASQAAHRFAYRRHRPRAASILALQTAPAWTFIPAPDNPLSATALRRAAPPAS